LCEGVSSVHGPVVCQGAGEDVQRVNLITNPFTPANKVAVAAVVVAVVVEW